MADVELEVLNRKHFGQRQHRDRKFYKKQKCWYGPPTIFKHLNHRETCYDYHGLQYEDAEKLDTVLTRDKSIKKDPFNIYGYDIRYSLNKKKRWLIPEMLHENIEDLQKPELNFKVSAVTSTPSTSLGKCECEVNNNWDNYHDCCYKCYTHNYKGIYYEELEHKEVKKYAGYSKKENAIVKKTSKNKAKLLDLIRKPNKSRKDVKHGMRCRTPSPENCENRHKKLKQSEHDMSIVYVTEYQKFTKNQFNAGKAHKHYECTCEPVIPQIRPIPDFDKNDLYDYETVPMEDFYLSNEETCEEILNPKSTSCLEDFIVNKKKKEKRNKKKKKFHQIVNLEEDPPETIIKSICKEKIAEKSTDFNNNKVEDGENPVPDKPNYFLNKIDFSYINNCYLEKWLKKMIICDKIVQSVASITVKNRNLTNLFHNPAWNSYKDPITSSITFIARDGSEFNVFPAPGLYKKEFENFGKLDSFILIVRNIDNPEKLSYYFQYNNSFESQENDQSKKRKPKTVKSIFPSILDQSTFLPAICLSSDEAKEKSIMLSSDVKKQKKNKEDNDRQEVFDFICRVCYVDDSDERSGFALKKCNHYFCLDCWYQYITSAIDVGQVPIECMENDCSNVILPKILTYFFKQELVEKYSNMVSERRLMRKDFIECKRCDQTIFLDNFDYTKVKNRLTICSCGQTYCVDCRQRAHLPLTCDERRIFVNKNKDNGDLLDALHFSEAALCPGCGGLVDKTFGCNHMTCRCGYEFCYACGKPYFHHECEGQMTRMPILMLDVTNLNIPPTAFTEVVVWKQKREHQNLWKLRKMYRKKSNDELAIKVVSQYSQLCQLIEYAHIKQILFLRQKRHKSNFKLVNRQFNELINRLDFILEKLLNPSNEPEIILTRVFTLSKGLISLCTNCM